MRVVLLLRSMETGGTQRQAIELARGLAADRVDIRVVLFYGHGELVEDLRGLGIPVHVVGKRGIWDQVGFGGRLLALLRSLRPDVLYSFLTAPNVIAAVASVFLPKTALVWGVRGSALEADRYGMALRVSFVASRLLARKTDLIISNSEAGKRDHVTAGYPPHKTIVIPNGIDTDRFQPARHLGFAVRERWGLEEDDLVVGVPARLDPMKGHDVFLDAAVLLRNVCPRAVFVVAGPGPDGRRRQLVEKAQHLGLQSVMHFEIPTDMPSFYNALDIAVLPSLFGEGFPNVVAEAMASGVATVVTDVGDAAAIVGATGEVAAPGDAPDLARAMLRCLRRLEHDRERMASTARARVLERYNTDLMVRRTFECISEVAR